MVGFSNGEEHQIWSKTVWLACRMGRHGYDPTPWRFENCLYNWCFAREQLRQTSHAADDWVAVMMDRLDIVAAGKDVEPKSAGSNIRVDEVLYRQDAFIKDRREVMMKPNYPENVMARAMSQQEQASYLRDTGTSRDASHKFLEWVLYIGWVYTDEELKGIGEAEYEQIYGLMLLIPHGDMGLHAMNNLRRWSRHWKSVADEAISQRWRSIGRFVHLKRDTFS